MDSVPLNPSYTNTGTYFISLIATDSSGNTDFFSDSIVVVPPPLANFVTGPACVNQPINFNDSSIVNPGSITGWLWDFGDGTTDNVQNPVHVYTNDSSYVVTLTVTSNAGCSDSVTDTIVVHDSPTVYFSFSNFQCAHAPVQFTDSSIAPSGSSITAWEWNFGDGTLIDTAQNPIHAFDSTGIFYIQLIAYSDEGCSDTLIDSIMIVPGPLADFTMTNTCVGDTVMFTNASTIVGVATLTYEWDFGDVTFSTDTNPTHPYAPVPATYPVQLIATSSNGCTDTVIKNVRISSKANPGFITSFTLCVGYPVQFIDTSTIATGDSIILSSWDFGDSSTGTGDTVSHIYTSANQYTVTLTVTSLTACDTSISKQIFIDTCPASPCPIAGFIIPDTACAKVPIPVTNTSIYGINYDWDFCAGDLDSVPTCAPLISTALFNSPYGSDMVTDGVNWYGFVVNYTGNNILRFNFGNSLDNIPAAPVVIIPSMDTLNSPADISVINDNGNWYALVTNNNADIIKLTMDSLTDTAPIGQAIINSGGFTAPYQACLIKDGADYKYVVAYFANNAIGIFDFGTTLSNNVLGFDSIAFPVGESCTSISVAKDCDQWYGIAVYYFTGVVRSIHFGTSVTGTALSINDIATLISGGAREVQVVNDNSRWYAFVLNQIGNDFTRIDFGTSLSSLTPAVLPLNLVSQLATNFSFTLEKSGSKWYGFTPDNGSSQTLRKISFQDSCSAVSETSINLLPQNLSYTASGTYNICLTVTDFSGNIDLVSDSIFILPAPDVNFSTSAACLNSPVIFTDLTTISSGTLISWYWTFGDSTSDTSQNPVHTYPSAGSFVVSLTVTSDANCSFTYSDTITVHELPVAGFNFVNNQCSETPVVFTDTSTAPSGETITSWQWSFGDGDNSIAQSPSHSYDTSGTFNVQLIVFSDAGCSDTITSSITILFKPRAGFMVTNTCVGDTVQFTDATISTGAIAYDWDFDDTGTSTLQNPSHPYAPVPFTYNVVLIVIDITNGCSDTVMQSVHIGNQANPGFIFIPDTLCAGNIIQFIDTSTIAAGDSISLSSWDFGDSTSGFGDTITHVYANNGTYTITLTVTAWTACDTSISQTINVLESPVAGFTSNDTCLGFAISFMNTSTTPGGTIITNYLWQFGDSTTDTASNPSHTYANAGTYYVTLTVTNDFGCTGTISDSVTVYAKPVAQFTITQIYGCSKDTVFFVNTSSIPNSSDTLSSFFWDFDDGNTSALSNPQHIFQTAGLYQVHLTVTSQHGCVDDTIIGVQIYDSPHFSFSFSHTCLGETTQFTFIDSLANVIWWDWDFGDGNGSGNSNPFNNYLTSGTFTIILSAMNNVQCTTTVSNTIIVHPLPVAGAIISDTVICNGGTITFNDNSSIPSGFISTYQWDFGDGSPLDNNQNTSHLYDSTDTFLISHIVTSGEGCKDTSFATITVHPHPEASFTANTYFGSPPLNVSFTNTTTGGDFYQWNFGDGSLPDNNQNTSHTYLDTGYYQVMMIATNIFGCKDTATAIISVLIPNLEEAVMDVWVVQQDNLLSISAKLGNLGNIYINRFQISAWIENGSRINEQWQGAEAFVPGDTMHYHFAARFVVDPENMPAYYCVEISEINDTTDGILSNNKKCAVLSESFNICPVFPNPTTDDFTFCVIVPFEGIVSIRIVDARGRLVRDFSDETVSQGYNEFTKSLYGIAQGVYIVEVIYNDELKAGKLFKNAN